MTIQMHADSRSIAFASVTTRVSLDRSDPEAVVFRYEGDLSESDQGNLIRAAAACSVRRTLSKEIRFEPAQVRA